MKQEQIIKEIEKILPQKEKLTFTASVVGVKKESEPYTARGWNTARYLILEHFKSLTKKV